jgi:probable addiction module antidote protein
MHEIEKHITSSGPSGGKPPGGRSHEYPVMTAASRPFRQTQNAILRDPQTAAIYLKEALAAGDIAAFKLVLRNVVEAQGGMAALAEETDLSRETLYRTLSERGNPTLETLSRILGALGLRVAVQVEKAAQASQPAQRLPSQ